MKPRTYAIIAFCLAWFGYWLSGGDFERGWGLLVAYVIAVPMALTGYAIGKGME